MMFFPHCKAYKQLSGVPVERLSMCLEHMYNQNHKCGLHQSGSDKKTILSQETLDNTQVFIGKSN